MTAHPIHPRVSVVIPTYNREQYLAESIDSVLAQRFDGLEIVVVDDGSTDGTEKLLQAYGNQILPIRQTNQGVAAATMHGIERVAAPLIALHDSDDRMLPGRLQTQCEFLDTHPQVTAVAGNMQFEGNEETNYLESVGVEFNASGYALFEDPYERIVTRNFMANASSCFRRDEFFAAGGYDLSYRAVQDGEFWFRVARTWTLACINHPCTWVRVHEGSLSTSSAALEGKLRLYERELASAELVTPAVRQLIERRLRHLTREYVRSSLTQSDNPRWRELVRQAARHISLPSRLALTAATRLPGPVAHWLC